MLSLSELSCLIRWSSILSYIVMFWPNLQTQPLSMLLFLKESKHITFFDLHFWSFFQFIIYLLSIFSFIHDYFDNTIYFEFNI